MTTAVLVRPEVDTAETEPICQVVERPESAPKPCRTTATWAVTLPCCGRRTLSCEWHRWRREIANCGTARCKGCGTIYASTETWRWERL